MSLASEITRLQNAKSALKTSIEAKGVTVSDSTLISDYPALVDQIQTGGGGGNEDLIDLIERDITTFNIPEGTTKIGIYAFYNCSNLSDITIPNSVTSINQGAFQGCSSLSDITISEGVTSIDRFAFQGCSSLSDITISEGVTSIGDSAFYNCSNLSDITIPNSVTSIGNSAFYNCQSLTSLVLNGGGVIGSGTSWGTLGAFGNCYKLENVTIGNSVTSLGINCFSSCNSNKFNSIVIPDSVTYIGYYCFSSCSHLNSITIGNGITNIDQQAFVHCSGLTSLTINATTPPTLGANALLGTNANLIIYVPAESVDAYKQATNWSELASRIQAIPTE